MPLIEWAGVLLERSGVMADDLACCCVDDEPPDPENECCCPIFLAAPPVATVTLTVDAPGCPEIDGATTLLTLAVGGGCITYAVFTWTIGNCGSSVQVNFSLSCPTDGVSAQDMVMDFLPQSSGCAATGANGVAAEAGATCDPLYLRFAGFILRDAFGVVGECECCPDSFAVIITA